jgi:hypothetical protein
MSLTMKKASHTGSTSSGSTTRSAQTNIGTKPQCVLDRSLINQHTLRSMRDIGLSFFADACGRNRGAFVTDPPDGHTYGCLTFPPAWSTLVLGNSDAASANANATTIQNSNDIVKAFAGGSITAAQAVDLLDLFTQAVYTSSSNVQDGPFACDMSGLAHLVHCDRKTSSSTATKRHDSTKENDKESMLKSSSASAKHHHHDTDDNNHHRHDSISPKTTNRMPKTIRSVTLAGLFVPAPWVGPALNITQAELFYTQTDFHDIYNLGLNTVLIPLPTGGFTRDIQRVLTSVLDKVHDAGLQTILSLTPDAAGSTSKKASTMVHDVALFSAKNERAILGLIVPSASSVATARAVTKSLALFVPAKVGDLPFLRAKKFDRTNVFVALDLSHSSSVADVASDTSLDDRGKLFYHEATSCMQRSPLEYTACYQGMPVFVYTGFDLSIDGCAQNGSNDEYGQCDRFEETVNSKWWHTHRKSYAARQLYSLEQGMGWSFATYKLWDIHDDDKMTSKKEKERHSSRAIAHTDPDSILDQPAKLMALKNVVAAGLFPSLKHTNDYSQACLNPPLDDFVMGDATLSPTPAPPPDCGNGTY